MTGARHLYECRHLAGMSSWSKQTLELLRGTDGRAHFDTLRVLPNIDGASDPFCFGSSFIHCRLIDGQRV